MKVPSEPPIGSLIAYEYLWSSQAARRKDGEKVYPTALILAKRAEFNSLLVYALGISHMPPSSTRRALEVPSKLRRWIGLDNRPQWIYTDELNIFIWPGPDLRPAYWISRRGSADSCVLGALPNDWFEQVKKHFVESYQLKLVRVGKRTR